MRRAHLLAPLAALILLVAPATAVAASPRALPQAECKSAYGQTACGYGCVAAGGRVACASVPWGACRAAYGKVVCWPSGEIAQWPDPLPPKAVCKAAGGQVACGYGCATGYGQVRCAQHPGGACLAAGGHIVCSDPPPRQDHAANEECRTAYGRTVCGYACAAGFGDVRCADHPGGVCVAAYGRVTCSQSPSARVRPPPRPNPARPAPRAECRSAYGKSACGYGCVAAYGDVRCSAVPGGRCAAAFGKITCSGD